MCQCRKTLVFYSIKVYTCLHFRTLVHSGRLLDLNHWILAMDLVMRINVAIENYCRQQLTWLFQCCSVHFYFNFPQLDRRLTYFNSLLGTYCHDIFGSYCTVLEHGNGKTRGRNEYLEKEGQRGKEQQGGMRQLSIVYVTICVVMWYGIMGCYFMNYFINNLNIMKCRLWMLLCQFEACTYFQLFVFYNNKQIVNTSLYLSSRTKGIALIIDMNLNMYKSNQSFFW